MSQLTHAVRRSPRRARLTAAAVLVALAALMLVWIGRASADEVSPAATISRTVSNVPTGKADAVDASDFQCTCTPNFVDMPGMSETFSFGGTASRSVLVLFQSEWAVLAFGTAAIVRLTIDGVVHGPDEVVLVRRQGSGTDSGPFGTHGFNFVTAPLSPGQHTAKIQWRDSGQGPAYVTDRSLIILHK
jgi:hypothetical protein